MEVVGQLTGGVAHDFNNLLAVIYGNLELLMEHGESDPLVTELAGDALNAAQHGASLTNQLLAFSRQQQLAPSAVNIGTLIVNTIGMLRRVVEESIEIVTAVPPDLWQSQIDAQQLVNALLNLLINARDAMPRGGTVTISAENAILDLDYTNQYAEVMPGRYVKLMLPTREPACRRTCSHARPNLSLQRRKSAVAAGLDSAWSMGSLSSPADI
jgi:signal transduction histidine kinase